MQKMKSLTVNGRHYTIEDPDSVSYGESQSLTDTQKATARDNIGAMGVGEVLDVLVAFSLAPVLLDSNGAMLVESDNTILINM